MQYRCSRCRCPLQTGQTMCGCGQLFNPVPVYNPNSLSNYYPWTSTSQPAIVRWWSDISFALKASVAGGAALVGIIIIVGDTAHHYQSLHSRYAPGTPVMAASIVPVPVQSPAAPVAPSAPTPIVLQAAPQIVPPPGHTRELPTPTFIPAPPSALPNQAAPEGNAPTSSEVSDPTGQAEAAWQDAEAVVQQASNECNTASDAGSQRGPDWISLSARVAGDRSAVVAIQSNLSPEEYGKATRAIDRFQSALDQLHQTWNQSRSMSQINIG